MNGLFYIMEEVASFVNFLDGDEDPVDYQITPYLAPHKPVIPASAKNDSKFYEKFYWSFSYTNAFFLSTSILFIVWVIGMNLLCIAGILRSQRKLLSDYYLINLAASDILVGILVLPFMCMVVLLGYFPFGHSVCSFWIFCDYYLIIAGAYGTAGLLICYLWMIRWPEHYEKKDSKSHRTIILTQWVLVNVAWGPSFFHDRFHTDMNGQGICGYNIGLNSYFTLYIGVFGLYIPGILACGSALWCAVVLYKHHARNSTVFFGEIVPQDQRQAPIFLIKSLPSSSSSSDEDKDEEKGLIDIAISHLPLVLGTLILFLTSRCFFYIYFAVGAFVPDYFPPDLSNGVYWVMHSNAALSPILHITFDRQLRRGVFQILFAKGSVEHRNEIVL